LGFQVPVQGLPVPVQGQEPAQALGLRKPSSQKQ
jgi:hypothetical protein